MTFYVNGIKQENDTEHKVEMLIDIENALIARTLLEEKQILILSLNNYLQDKKTFGDIYFTIQYDKRSIDIITKITDLQEAANFFTFIGFDLIQINRFSTPISLQESQTIISKAQQQAEEKKMQIWKNIIEQEEQERKMYEDPKLESARKIIDIVFAKVDTTLKRSAGQIGGQENKKLKMLTDELKKLRLGTNFEKIRNTIQEIFTILERIDDAYFASIQDASPLGPETVITQVDVDRECERLEKVKILRSLGAKIAFTNQDYATFGTLALYRKFLQKDLGVKLSNLSSILYSLYDIGELILLVALSLFGVYTLANQIYLFSVNPFGLAYVLMNIGLWGMVIFAARYFRTKNIGRLLLVIALAILLHYLLLWAVTTNFAL